MELSNEQLLLMNGLDLCGLQKEAVMGVMLMLQEPEQIMKMTNWMADRIEKDSMPNEEEIFEQAYVILKTV